MSSPLSVWVALKPFLGLLRWRWVGGSVLLGFLTIGSSVGLMGLSAWLISRAALHPSIAVLGIAIVGVRFFGILRGVMRYAERVTSHETTFRLLRDLRVWFYEQIEPLSPAHLIEQRSGDLLARVMNDIETLENLYLRVIAPPLVALLLGGVMVVGVGLFSLWLSPILLLGLMAVGGGMPYLAWRANQMAGKGLIQTRAELNTHLLDGIQGLADVLLLAHSHAYAAQFSLLNQKLAAIQQQLARQQGFYLALGGLFVNLTVLASLVVAIPRINPLLLAPIALMITACFEAFLPLSAAFQQLGSNMEAGQRLLEISHLPRPKLPPVSPQPTEFSLEFDQVSFRYQPDAPWAVQDVTFSLAQGQRLVITGTSGRGKSTLVNLLLRFWEVETGEIRLGGLPLTAYRVDDLCRLIGVVNQQPHIFNATIRENLLLASPGADEQRLLQVANQTHLYDLIMNLPQGFDTWIGEQGYNLSGGERQRLALARVLLKDAPIMILDEPTAHLDADMAQAVIHSIDAATVGKTLLLITHQSFVLSSKYIHYQL
jgi:ATP-binding cassette subfamily C protein CydC